MPNPSGDAKEIAAIGRGLLVLLGVHRDDGGEQADRLARKLLSLRVFEDADGRMNLSVREIGGEVLCVSQFTLLGDLRRGTRPSFGDAAPPEAAAALYERVLGALGALGGRFGAHIHVALVNDGPVTLMVDV